MIKTSFLLKRVKILSQSLHVVCGLVLVLAVAKSKVPVYQESLVDIKTLQDAQLHLKTMDLIGQSVKDNPYAVAFTNSLQAIEGNHDHTTRFDYIYYHPSPQLDSNFQLKNLRFFFAESLEGFPVFMLRTKNVRSISDTVSALGCQRIAIDSIKLHPPENMIIERMKNEGGGDRIRIYEPEKNQVKGYRPFYVNVDIYFDTTVVRCVRSPYSLDSVELNAITTPVLHKTLQKWALGMGLGGSVSPGESVSITIDGTKTTYKPAKFQLGLFALSDVKYESLKLTEIKQLLTKELDKSGKDVKLFDLQIPGQVSILVAALIMLSIILLLAVYFDELRYQATVSDTLTFEEDWPPIFRSNEMGIIYYLITSGALPIVTTFVILWEAIDKFNYPLFILGILLIISIVANLMRFLTTIKALRKSF